MATHRETYAQSAGRTRKPTPLRRGERQTRPRGLAMLTVSAAIAATAATGYYAVKPVETAQANFAACVSAVEHEQQQVNATVREKERTTDNASSEQRLAALAQCTAAQ